MISPISLIMYSKDIMKNRVCFKKSMKILEIGIKRATSYKVVKGRLSRGFYSDELLQIRLKYGTKELQNSEVEV
jgi:hypothetical protein